MNRFYYLSKLTFTSLFIFLLLSTQTYAQCPVVEREVINCKSSTQFDAIGAVLKNFFSDGSTPTWLFEPGATFVENGDGTADLRGVLAQYPLPSTRRFQISVHFINQTYTGTPMLMNTTPNTEGWYYYTWGESVLTGLDDLEGAEVKLFQRSKPAQVGIGGADQVPDINNLGASAWFSWQIVSQPNNTALQIIEFPANPSIDQGDFCFVMSGTPSDCRPPKGNIGDQVYCDNNNNGIFDNGDVTITGLTVTLCDANGVVITTQDVDADGKYLFTELAAGTYIVKFPETTSDGKSQVNQGPIQVVLGEGETFLDADKGYFKPVPKGNIGDQVYCDNNNNGVFDNGDVTVTGLTITLCDENFVTITTQSVDADGKYLFTDLAAGTYWVKFPETTLDGKPQVNLGPIKVVLGEGETFLDADKGYFKPIPKGNIGDQVYCDNNNNGVFDNGDVTVTGLTITLCDENFVTITTQAVDADGKYLFTDLAAGTYWVKFPETTLDGKPQVNLGPIKVVLGEGETFLDADKGYFKPACVFEIDVNKCYRLTSKGNPNSLTTQTQTSLSGTTTIMVQRLFTEYNTTQIFKFVKLSNGSYRIIEQKSGRDVTLINGTCTNGNRLTLARFTGSLSQQWKLECVENGYFKLISLCCPNQVVDLGAGSIQSGRPAILTTYGNKDCQKWQAVPVECTNPCANDVTKPVIQCPADIVRDVTGLPSSHWIVNYPHATATDNCCVPKVECISGLPSGSCFPLGTSTVTFRATDLRGNSSTCSFNITIKRSTPTCHTSFSSTKTYRIVNVMSNKVLDVFGGGTKNDTRIVQYGYHGATNQQVRLYPLGSGFFKIVFRNSGKVLANHTTQNLSNCHLFDYYSGGYKDWKIECNSDGTYKIIHRASGRVLDIENDSKSDAANVEIRTWDGTNSQKWRIEEIQTNVDIQYLANSARLTMEASAEPTRTRIEWVNNTGYKNDFFAVQKMNVKGDFDDIEVLNSFDLTEELQHFTAYDNNPTEGDNFYRVKVAYNDGTFGYTETQKVTFDKLGQIRTFPNPATDYVDMELSKYKGLNVNIHIYNQFGQQVHFQNIENVSDMPVRMDVSTFTTGNYIIRVTSKGKRDETKQISITH